MGQVDGPVSALDEVHDENERGSAKWAERDAAARWANGLHVMTEGFSNDFHPAVTPAVSQKKTKTSVKLDHKNLLKIYVFSLLKIE